MKRWLVSTTSTFALLFCAVRTIAAPTAPVSDAVVAETVDRNDVVRESLGLGVIAVPSIPGVAPTETAEPSGPTIADPSAQTPSATFTYRPAAAVRGDNGLVGSLAGNTRRNPGNVSNLKGTIGASAEGIFSVPAPAILVEEMPRQEVNYLFQPLLAAVSALDTSNAAEIVQHEPFQENPSASVFVGTMSPIGDPEKERAARDAIVASATGSATPTVKIVPPPDPNGPSGGLASQSDDQWGASMGFATTALRPSPLRTGAVATTTIGYTYRPISLKPVSDNPPATVTPTRQTLSATITAPDGSLAYRASVDRVAPVADADKPPARLSTASAAFPHAGIPFAAEVPIGVATDTFVVAEDDLQGRMVGMQRVTIPIRRLGVLAEPEASDRSIIIEAKDDTEQAGIYLGYGLIAGAVMIPFGLAFLAYRLIRRSALDRFG